MEMTMTTFSGGADQVQIPRDELLMMRPDFAPNVPAGVGEVWFEWEADEWEEAGEYVCAEYGVSLEAYEVLGKVTLLETLKDLLNLRCVDVGHMIDLASLPNWGRAYEADTLGVFSWDDTEVLISDGAGWVLECRFEYEFPELAERLDEGMSDDEIYGEVRAALARRQPHLAVWIAEELDNKDLRLVALGEARRMEAA